LISTIERLEEDSAAASDQKADGAQGLRSVCNSVLLKEFRTKVNGKGGCNFCHGRRIVTERRRELSVSLLQLMLEHWRKELQKSVTEFGTLLAPLEGALLS
jgi:hypothetical protein